MEIDADCTHKHTHTSSKYCSLASWSLSLSLSLSLCVCVFQSCTHNHKVAHILARCEGMAGKVMVVEMIVISIRTTSLRETLGSMRV